MSLTKSSSEYELHLSDYSSKKLVIRTDKSRGPRMITDFHRDSVDWNTEQAARNEGDATKRMLSRLLDQAGVDNYSIYVGVINFSIQHNKADAELVLEAMHAVDQFNLHRFSELAANMEP